MKPPTGLLSAMPCPTAESFFIRHDNRYVQVFLREIVYIKAFKNYIRIVTPGRIYTPLLSMKQMQAELPKTMFCRVHRSYIVAMRCITAFDHEQVYLDKTEIPLSDNYREDLMRRTHVLISDARQPPKDKAFIHGKTSFVYAEKSSV